MSPCEQQARGGAGVLRGVIRAKGRQRGAPLSSSRWLPSGFASETSLGSTIVGIGIPRLAHCTTGRTGSTEQRTLCRSRQCKKSCRYPCSCYRSRRGSTHRTSVCAAQDSDGAHVQPLDGNGARRTVIPDCDSLSPSPPHPHLSTMIGYKALGSRRTTIEPTTTAPPRGEMQ